MKPIRMPIPCEHEAWAMLYTPFLVTSMIIGKFDGKSFCLLIALTAMFFSHEALALLARMSGNENVNVGSIMLC